MKKNMSRILVSVLIIALCISMTSFLTAFANQQQGLDYGLYWFGLGDVSQKFIAGQQNPYYDPAKPTVIFVHGWQKGTTVSGYRTTFNYLKNDSTYGVNVDAADAWIKKGWNIGIFYWNQFADEDEVTDAEAKIWSANGPKQMRWRKSDGTYSNEFTPNKSAGDLFYDTFVAAMSGYKGNNIRIAGHSLGNQMAVRLAKMVSDSVDNGTLPSNLRPKRVALLDPFWSKYGKDYLNGKTTGETVRTYTSALISKGVVFEQYRSSGINAVGIGDANTEIEKLTCFVNMAPWYVPSHDLAGKHSAAYNLYFLSFGSEPPKECTINWLNQRKLTGKSAASASTSDERIKEMMVADKEWTQVEGRYTQSTDDDWYEVKSR